ncbi:MAG: hypothetical protein WCT01_02665 [Candidatus Shapirobacteria bacterium]|jgi:hypothetical protein
MTQQEELIASRVNAKSADTVKAIIDTDRNGVRCLRANLAVEDTDIINMELAAILPIARE